MLRCAVFVFLCASAPALAAGAPPDEAAKVSLEDCRALLMSHDALAERCFRSLAAAPETSREDAAVARALADVAADLSRPPHVAEAPADRTVSVSRLIDSGAPELVLSSAAYGGVAGFLTAGTLLSATRISQLDSLPWLVGAPALGILAGGAVSSAAAYALPLQAGDAALVSSTLWLGSAWGFALQLAVFDQRDDVGHVPLRFASVLAGGLGLGALGAAAAWGFDIDAGDVGLMNSAALWSPLLVGLGWLTLAPSGLIVLEPGHPFTTLPGVVMLLLTTSALPWTLSLALHPFLDVERPATWLIEAGGVTGLLVGAALMAFFANARLPTAAYPGILTATTTLGVMGGTALTFVVSDLVFHDAFSAGPLLSPALLPPAPGREGLAPAALATWRF